MLLEGEYEKASTFLYKQDYKQVERYVRKNGGSKEDAQDVFQNGVIKILLYVRERENIKTNFNLSGFLFTCCKNLWLNQIKKRKYELNYVEENSEIAKDLNDFETIRNRKEVIVEIISQMTERCKNILRLSVYTELEMKEIQQRLGYSSVNATKTVNYQCKKALSQLLIKNRNRLGL